MRLRRSAERFSNFVSQAWIESFSAAAAGMRIFSQSTESRAQEHNVEARLVKLERIGLAAKTARRTWLVRADFEDILRTLQRTNDRQKMLARHAVLVSDERLPLQVTPVPGISVLEGRVLGHGHDEVSDRPYLLLEASREGFTFSGRTPRLKQSGDKGFCGSTPLPGSKNRSLEVALS